MKLEISGLCHFIAYDVAHIQVILLQFLSLRVTKCENTCTRSLCSTTMKKSSHKHHNTYYVVESDCAYFHAYKRVPDDISRTHTCTNKVLFCPTSNCNSVVWKYNITNHFKFKHPQLEVPQHLLVSDEEKRAVKKKLQSENQGCYFFH